MRTFEPSESELPPLRYAAKQLKAANLVLAESKKEADAAKQTLIDWLKNERKVEIETLPIGELIIIKDVVLVEVSKQSRFDEKGFMAADPEQCKRWKKDFPVVKYKPQV